MIKILIHIEFIVLILKRWNLFFSKLQGLTLLFLGIFAGTALCQSEESVSIFEIGKADNSSAGMALAPDSYENFLKNDFGWEDRYFIVGHSKAQNDWPYVLPGPKDSWGGTGPTSGIRSHVLNILWGFKAKPKGDNWHLTIDLLGYNGEAPPLFKVTVNGSSWKYQLPESKGDSTLIGDLEAANDYNIEIPIDKHLLKKGGNEIKLTLLQGSWIVFDHVKLEGSEDIPLEMPNKAFVRDVKVADYEIQKNGIFYQPLLVDVEHLEGKPDLHVEIDGKKVFGETLEKNRYRFEVPMSAVESNKISFYEVYLDGIDEETGYARMKDSEGNWLSDFDPFQSGQPSYHKIMLGMEKW